MSNDIDKIAEMVMNLKGSELVQLRDVLLEKLGLSADALAGTGGGGAAAVEDEAAAGPSLFRVVMTGVGTDFKKTALIKELMGLLSLGVADAKKVVEAGESGEKEIKAGLSKEDAESLKKSLESHGALISVSAA